INFINTIRRKIGQRAGFAAAPENFNSQQIGAGTSSEDAHVIIAAKIATTAHHFLALKRHGTAANNHLCADAARVWSQPFEPTPNAWRNAVIAVNADLLVEAVR